MTREELENLQLRKLKTGLAYVLSSNPFYIRKFQTANVTINDIRSLADVSKIPFTTKEELLDDQQASPPYGSHWSGPIERFTRLHQTSGTSGRRLRWLDTPANWNWLLGLWDQIFSAVEVRSADRFFFPFSFGPFLAFWAAFEGAARAGHFTLAGGGMSSVARLQAIAEHEITVVCTTPTYALHLSSVASQEKTDLSRSPVRLLLLAGEPGANIPAVRRQLEAGWGARVIDHSGMTEIGSLGIEYASLPGKLFLLEQDCIAEFLEPRGTAPVPEGSPGELVLTNLGRWDSPLLRYRTGDVGVWRRDMHPPGLPYTYLDGGLLGRVDDMFWIKGNNVYPSTFEAILREIPGIAEYRVELDESSLPAAVRVTLEAETGVDPAVMVKAVEKSFHTQFYYRPKIQLAPAGSLPRFDLKAKRFIRTSGTTDPHP